MSERKQISVSAVIDDLNNGLSRLQIGEKYGLTAREVKEMFKHPSLKGKKAKKVFKPSFELVDDTANVEEKPAEKNTNDDSVDVGQTDSTAPQPGLFQ